MRIVAGISIIALLAVTAVVYAQYGGDYDYNRPAAGASVVPQLRTARTHAANAASSEVMGGAIDHLTHVVNCIEGQRGANYNSRALNPCEGQGNGLIPDLQADSARGQADATKALDFVRQADRLAVETLKVTEFARVKTAATRVTELLGEALKAIGQ